MITPIFIRLPGMSFVAMACVAMACVVVLWPATNIFAATNELADSDDIRVEVLAGVATLQGTVEDWHELQSARKNARDGGATAVINKLKIANGNGA